MLTSFSDIDPISLLLDKCLKNIEELLGDLIVFPFSYKRIVQEIFHKGQKKNWSLWWHVFMQC
jgi:hypothetical protein